MEVRPLSRPIWIAELLAAGEACGWVDDLLVQNGIPWRRTTWGIYQSVSVEFEHVERALALLGTEAAKRGYGARYRFVERGGRRYHLVADFDVSQAGEERAERIRISLNRAGLDAYVECHPRFGVVYATFAALSDVRGTLTECDDRDAITLFHPLTPPAETWEVKAGRGTS